MVLRILQDVRPASSVASTEALTQHSMSRLVGRRVIAPLDPTYRVIGGNGGKLDKTAAKGAAKSAAKAFRIDVDLEHARAEGDRVRGLLASLRRRHALARYEYTRIVRIVPGGETFANPVLTLGNRFADGEDTLLSTYLHEQMHWYLWYLGTPDRDMVAPFMDELVRRYPDAPITPPEGARGYQATYVHLVVNWLEIAAAAEFIGRKRAVAIAETPWGYRWIYRTVLKDWDALGELYERHGIVPIRTVDELAKDSEKASRRRGGNGRSLNGAPKRNGAAGARPHPPRSRHRLRVRGGKSPG
jgi:hypothetical protein